MAIIPRGKGASLRFFLHCPNMPTKKEVNKYEVPGIHYLLRCSLSAFAGSSAFLPLDAMFLGSFISCRFLLSGNQQDNVEAETYETMRTAGDKGSK